MNDFTEQTDLQRQDWIAGLDKGLALLEAFDRDHPCLTATEAAERTGLSRTAARRYLLTLEHLGYLYRDGKRFGLTPRVLKVGWSYFDSASLPRLLQPYLQRVTGRSGESAYASVLDGWDLVFIARNGASRVMTTGFVLGARVPAQLTSPGIALLAYRDPAQVQAWLDSCLLMPFTPHTMTDSARLFAEIETARRQGYVLVEQQLQTGVRGIAVPLRDRHGRPVAALSTSMPMGNESSQAALARVLPVLQETANGLLNQL
jgi:IclR family pca regulon transcriptional regulator